MDLMNAAGKDGDLLFPGGAGRPGSGGTRSCRKRPAMRLFRACGFERFRGLILPGPD